MKTVDVKIDRNQFIEGRLDNFVIYEHPYDQGVCLSTGSTMISAMIDFIDKYFEKHDETVELTIVEI